MGCAAKTSITKGLTRICNVRYKRRTASSQQRDLVTEVTTLLSTYIKNLILLGKSFSTKGGLFTIIQSLKSYGLSSCHEDLTKRDSKVPLALRSYLVLHLSIYLQ